MNNYFKIIQNEFEQINSPFDDPVQIFVEKFGNRLEIPEEYLIFMQNCNGIKRVADDDFFTFSIHPLENTRLYDDLEDMSDDEKREMLALNEDENPGDWIVIGNEGEFGLYILNCAPDSANFGFVAGVVNNIPERFKTWDTFFEFIHGIPQYCEKFPLEQYKEELPGSNPVYGKM